MNVLVIGSGGREHALIWKIKQSRHVEKLYCAPGNPGIESLARCITLAPTDQRGLRDFATKQHIDLIVVGPEQPLAEGIADVLGECGLKVFGPTKRAAELEWSKAFAKDFMARHRIPSARHQTFKTSEREKVVAALESWTYPLVLKADGLAAGKGVIICKAHDEAVVVLREMIDAKLFGPAGDTVIIEEFMVGEEASLFVVTDGMDYITLAPAQDHKRVFDNDQGKNTGGMGAYAPAPVVSNEVLEAVKKSIVEPTLKGMLVEGRRYKGCLYVGVMLTSDGPKVVEYNSRFGDPETQVILPLYSGDLVELMLASCEERIGSLHVDERPVGSAVCVVLASGGYPDRYTTGKAISGLEDLPDNVLAFHAGTKVADNRIVSSGGRVLGVTAISQFANLEKTIAAAYSGVEQIRCEGMQYRRDIGRKALLRKQVSA